MTYKEHLKANIKVARRAARISLRQFLLAVFHAVHCVIPIKATEHERWGL